jgi:hypothetical protein
MQKFKIPGHLQDFLDAEFGWRLKEIADLKRSVKDASGSRQDTLLRAGVSLLYAHWEGFVKASAEGFINYVSNRGLKYSELRACFVMRGLKKEVSILAEARPGQRAVEAVEFVLSKLDERASIPFRGVVSARSNLNSEVFRDIAVSIGISPEPYETKYNLIDERLLSRRNRVAHGEYVDISAADFEGLADQVIGLLRAFKSDVENAMVLEGFRRKAV